MGHKIQLLRIITHILVNISIRPYLVFLKQYMVNNTKGELMRSQKVLYLHSGGFNIPFNGLWSLAKKSLQRSVPLIYCFPSNCTYNNISWPNSNCSSITKLDVYTLAFVILSYLKKYANVAKKNLGGGLLLNYSSTVVYCYNRSRYQSIFYNYYLTRPQNVSESHWFSSMKPVLSFLLLLVLMWSILKTQRQNCQEIIFNGGNNYSF